MLDIDVGNLRSPWAGLEGNPLDDVDCDGMIVAPLAPKGGIMEVMLKEAAMKGADYIHYPLLTLYPLVRNAVVRRVVLIRGKGRVNGDLRFQSG